MPPFPVARNRPDQSSGNHASKEILEVLVVLISSAIRQRSTETTWLARPQVASLSGNVRLVPAGTCWRTLQVAPLMYLSGSNARHFSSKADDAAANPVSAKCEMSNINDVRNISTGRKDLAIDHHGILATGGLYTQCENNGRLDKPRPPRCGARNAETGTLSRHSSMIVEVNDPLRSSQLSCNRSIRAERSVNGTMSRGSTIRVPSRVVWPRICPGGIATRGVYAMSHLAPARQQIGGLCPDASQSLCIFDG